MSIPVDELKNRLKLAMANKNLRPIELAEKTKIPKSSISQYMSGYSKPNSERVYLISKALNVSEAWLMGYDVSATRNTFNDNNPIEFTSPRTTDDYTTFPVIGDIAAGYDKIADETWEGESIDIPNSYLKGRARNDFFVLKVSGDSMYPLYIDGDYVLILKQTTLNHSGEVGAVLYEDTSATLKKVEYVQGEEWMKLIPINPNYPPKLIEGESLEHCRILGIPKYLIRETK